MYDTTLTLNKKKLSSESLSLQIGNANIAIFHTISFGPVTKILSAYTLKKSLDYKTYDPKCIDDIKFYDVEVLLAKMLFERGTYLMNLIPENIFNQEIISIYQEMSDTNIKKQSTDLALKHRFPQNNTPWTISYIKDFYEGLKETQNIELKDLQNYLERINKSESNENE